MALPFLCIDGFFLFSIHRLMMVNMLIEYLNLL